MDKKNDKWVQDTIKMALSGEDVEASSSSNESIVESVNQLAADDDFSSENEIQGIGEENTTQTTIEPTVTSSVEPEVQELSFKSKGKNKKSAKGKIIFVLILILALFGAAGWFAYSNFALVGDISGNYEIYSRSVSAVDLSGSDIDNFSGLSRLNNLEVINLTNTSIDDLTPLYECNALERVIMQNKVLYAQQCIEFYDMCPEAILICDVNVGGEVYDSLVEALKVSNTDADSIKSFAALRKLKKLDLSECVVSDDTYDYLCARLTNCDILRKVNFDGAEYLSDVKSLTLTADINESEIDRLKYFTALEIVDARACDGDELVNKISELYPQLKINSPITFLGVKVGTADEVIDLRGKKYSLKEVKAALAENLQYFNNLKKIDMCGCGLKNSEMQQLVEAYPDIKFVWIVKFGRWKVRTDAVVFSALNSNIEEQKIYSEKNYAPLFKYCTDLIAVDLGHSVIANISSISNFKNLRALILTDNKITDISSFAELKNLEFIEMNINRVKSVEPLKDLKNLKYINIYSSKSATDLSSLYNHDNLEITIFHRTVSQEERQRFRESNPNCQAFFSVDSAKITTNKAWRNNPYRISLKKAFSNWNKVVSWSEETGFIFDQNTNQYKYW